MKFFSIVILLFICIASKGQTPKIELYKERFFQANTNEQKLEALASLLEQRGSLSTDSLGHYIAIAKTLQQSTNNQQEHAKIVIAETYMFIRLGKLKQANEEIDAEIKKYPFDDAANRDIYFKLYEAKIDCIDYTDNYKEASAIAYKVIKEAESCNNMMAIANAYNSLSCWNYDMDFVDKAIQYSYKALSYTSPTPDYQNLLSGIYLNLGESYWWIDKLDSAEYYINKGIENAKKAENLNFQYYGLQKMASVKLSGREFAAAEQYVLKSFEIYKQLNGDIPSNRNLIALGNVYLKWNKPDEAIAFLTDGLIKDSLYDKAHNITADSSSTDIQRMYVVNLLARCYKLKGDYRNYASALEKVISEKDNFYKINSAQALAELQTKFDVQKKEATIASQQLMLVKRQIVITIISSVVLLILIIGFLYFRNYRKRQKVKSINAVKDAEEKERKRIAADLHDNLGAYAASIISNLDTIFPAHNNDPGVEALRDNSKAIVSQLKDTIWALKKDALTLTAISDRIKIFIQRIQGGHPDITVNVIEKIEQDFRLSPAHAFHLFRIAQEGISNALRHSKAKEVMVTIESNMYNWTMTIVDDGCGLPENIKHGNGLLNMKLRAEESGWQIKWVAAVPTGTVMTIQTVSPNNSNR